MKPRNKPKLKIRREIEVIVEGGEQLAQILQAVGLKPMFQYEKFRTTFVLPGLRQLKVELDETPIGVFVELEGGGAAIDRAAKVLGYARSDYIPQTYGRLYIAECRRSGRRPSNMLFRAKKTR